MSTGDPRIQTIRARPALPGDAAATAAADGTAICGEAGAACAGCAPNLGRTERDGRVEGRAACLVRIDVEANIILDRNLRYRTLKAGPENKFWSSCVLM